MTAGFQAPNTSMVARVTALCQRIGLPTVQRISGHKTLQMMIRYAHQNGEHIQAAMRMLEQRYNFAKGGRIYKYVEKSMED